MILQYIYKPVLNFIYDKITFRISAGVREAVLFISFFLMFLVLFLTMYMHIFSGNERDLTVCALMAVVILVSVDRRMELLKWRLVIYIPFALMGLYMLCVALFLHRIGEGYSIYILFILFITMCLAFVWGNRGDYGRLFMIVSAAYLLFFAILLLWCAAKYGLYFGHGYSMWMNTNGFAKLVTPAVGCGIHLFVVSDKRGWKILFGLLGGAAGCLTLFTTCRTAHIVVILMLIAFVILTVVRGRTPVKSILCFIIVFVLGFGASTGFLHFVTPVITDDPVSEHVVVQSEESEPQEEPKSYGEMTPYERYWTDTVEEVQSDPVLSRLDNISSGRIHIWAMYLKRINMTGNVKYLKKSGPHNQYVELTYRAGAPVGALWLFILFAVFVLIVHGIIRRKGDWIYYVTLSYPTFLFFSMLDTGMFPTERAFVLLYFLSLTPLLIKASKNSNDKHE